jgi:hypothetical protein
VNYRAILGALVAVGMLAGCDPYDDESGGQARVISVVLTDGSTPTEALADASGGAITVNGEDAAQNVVFVVTDRLLNGASIQTSVDDCTPANGWLTVTTTAAPLTCEAGETAQWYSCYVPSSPVPEQGGSVAIFQSCVAPNTTDGWFVLGELQPSSTYTFTGSIQDGSGNAVPVNVTVNTAAAAPAT